MSSKKATRRVGVLRNLPLIMIWRRTENLKTAKAFGKDIVGWPKIGENDYAAMYDAGSALIAYWTQDEELAKDAVAAVAGGNACSGLSAIKYPLISNPASELVVAPTNFRSVMQKLKAPSNKSNSNGEVAFSIVDEDGNYTRFIRPSESAFAGKAGVKLKSLLSNIRLESKRGVASKKVSQLVGYNLFVSDMNKSQAFYGKVLGLRTLQRSKREVKFDARSVILSIRPEPAMGLLHSLNRAGRLNGDWIAFHVKDMRAASKALAKEGVKFPRGVEESAHGLVAYFNDPDGHSLSLWQPPSQPTAIDYFPQMNRILRQLS